MSKRIILFGPLPPPYGGVAVFLNTLADHLRSPPVRLWTYGGSKDNKYARFIRHRLLGTAPALLAEGKGARILDASHFHLEYPNLPLLAIWLLLKRFLHFEWYKNIHDGSLPKRYATFSRAQRRHFHRAVNSVDKFVVVSDGLRRWLQVDIGARQPIVVVPGLLPPASKASAALSNETAELLKPFLRHAKRVSSIGVFFPSYGFKQVAEAVAQLREQSGIDLGLLLLDGGFVRDEAYRREVLRGRDWITVIEEIPNPEISEILKQSDVFVRAFADESYGISRIEALWAGIPVIATRAGETRGMLIYDFGDTKQLTTHLRSVLFDGLPHVETEWPELYRKEANNNLGRLAEVLGVKTNVR